MSGHTRRPVLDARASAIAALVAATAIGFGARRAGPASAEQSATSEPPAATAGQSVRPLRIEDIVARRPVMGIPPAGFVWAPDGSRYVYQIPGAHNVPVVRLHDLRTGTDRAVFSAQSSARGSRARPIGQIVFAPDGSRIAYLDAGALKVVSAAGTGAGAGRTLASEADDPQWSPDGRHIAYVAKNDLFAVDASRGAIARLTHDGSATRLNGDPDWLYSEELAVTHAYAWSPRGDAIAFLSTDESPVAPFPIQDYLPAHNDVEYQRYPLAGTKNPRVALRVAELRGGAVRTIYDGGPRDEYVLAPVWTPDGRGIIGQILDRPQHALRLVRFDRAGGGARTLVTETNAAFVEPRPAPRLLRDGSMLWLSQRGDVQDLERIASDGTRRRLGDARTIASLDGVDERAGVAYVTELYPTRLDRALLRVPLAGGAPAMLTRARGAHRFSVAANGGTAYIDTASSIDAPLTVMRRSLRDRDAAVVLFRTPSLARFGLGATRLVTIPSRWGDLDARLTVPANFDPSKRYPVVVEGYGGPLPIGFHSAAGRAPLWDQLLAQHGLLALDILTGPGERDDHLINARRFAGRMGAYAIDGPLAAAAWLRRQPYVDGTRLGLSGWSYGGYLTAYTLTHASGVYRSGIAGAPPSDWRWYDTAYTERYLRTPQRAPRAYRDASVVAAAGRLRGDLLVIQGSADDNVHLMNSLSLLQAFIRTGRQADYFVFPGARHGPTGVPANRYLDAKMLAWWERTLR